MYGTIIIAYCDHIYFLAAKIKIYLKYRKFVL